ncbi:MAG: tellurium resistance protein [Rhodobacteraceae bacterium]|nr:tellurium resistance protein [Paracoccaceae bacterium]
MNLTAPARKMPPPLRPQPRPGRWRRVPPAVFSALLGFVGLGLAWRRAAAPYLLPEGIGEVLLGVATALFGFAVLAYGAKVVRRPGVLAAEVETLPGRGGLSALSISLMAVAAALVPHARGLAEALVFVSLALHLGFALLIVRRIVNAAPEGRSVTPMWHLHFVGFIVAAIPAAALGLRGLALAILAITVPVAVLIWAASARQVLRRPPPPPLRPLVAIHLSPASLFAVVAADTGLPDLAFAFSVLSVAMFLVLLLAGPWMCRGGFTPMWGALTFPLAAFAVAMMVQATPQVLVTMMGFDAVAPFWRLCGAGALAMASVSIPWITFRVLRGWADGSLAAKTNAAIA